MAKGSYNVSVSGDSSLEDEKNYNENQECLNSCLSPSFLRSLSLHDRPRSSRIPTNKELRKSRYRALASTSLEKIPSHTSPPVAAKSECSTNHTSESLGMNADIEVSPLPSSSSAGYQEIGQNGLLEPNSWLEDRYTRFSVESEKLLEKTVAILRAVDEDITLSFANLTKPESIALESVTEIYRNNCRNTQNCNASPEFDSTESFSEQIYENWEPSIIQRPKDVQAHSQQSSFPTNMQVHSTQSPKNTQTRSTQQSPTNMQVHSIQQSSKNTQVHSTQQSPQNLRDQSLQLSPKNLLVHSPQKTSNFESLLNSNSGNTLSMTTLDSDVEEPIYENWPLSIKKSQKDTKSHSPEQSPKNTQAHSTKQSPKNLHPQSPLQSLLPSEETSTNFKSPISNSENTKPDSYDTKYVEQRPRNFVSSPTSTTEVKSRFDFYLPSDHEQFVKIIAALQNRCLEYREMIQDIALSALEELLNFPERSNGQILHLGRQLECQKRNFRDFKELCRKSVVFGHDSQPIDEKVTEVIQSFYLQLLQEENETFIARVEFGLKMGRVRAKFLRLEAESKKIINILEKEILYLKKTSVGFKV